MTIINSLPYQLVNGTTADASQVMANYNEIFNDVNANAAHNGTNSDITSITGLTTPLSLAQGGTAIYVGGTSTGSANAQILASPSPIGFTLTSGYEVDFIAGFSNTAAMTININSTGAIAVMKQTTSGLAALASGDIIATLAYCLIYDGTQYQIISKASTVTKDYFQVITSSGNFTAPSATQSTTQFKVTIIGGGASGGLSNSGFVAGGGAGATAVKYATGLTASSTYAVVIGAAGATISAAYGNGNNGGDSSIVLPSGTVTAHGGTGGQRDSSVTGFATGGTATGGDINISGQYGFAGVPAGIAGPGGSSTLGQGGWGANPQMNTNSSNSAPFDGTGYGSGGGGNYISSSPASYRGGAAMQGVCIIEWSL